MARIDIFKRGKAARFNGLISNGRVSESACSSIRLRAKKNLKTNDHKPRRGFSLLCKVSLFTPTNLF